MSSVNLRKSFKVACAMRNIEKKDLAEKVGVTKQYLTGISGTASVSVLKLDEVVKHLDMTVWEFLKLGAE